MVRTLAQSEVKSGYDIAGQGVLSSDSGGASRPDYIVGVEVDTGVKFKGKPLYRKTVQTNAVAPMSADTRIDGNFDDVFLDVSMSCVKFPDVVLPISHYYNDSNRVSAFIRKLDGYAYSDISIRTTFSGDREWTITYLYTKN